MKHFNLNVKASSLGIILIMLILSMQGCSVFPQAKEQSTTYYDWPKIQTELRKLNQWSLLGKFGIRTSEDSVTAAINKWDQENDQFEIDISSTFFGLGSSKLVGNANFLIIYEAGEDPVSSFEPDKLMESALGIPLPISYLPSWIKALPALNSKYQQTFNLQGLPESLIQDEWLLTFSQYHFEHKLPLPGKIKIQRDDIRIILAIKEWTIH